MTFSANIFEFFDTTGLDKYLQDKQHFQFEGHTGLSLKKQQRLQALCRNARTIMEIGFNAGHSAYLFLDSSTASLLSFDIGTHSYVASAKEFIDNKFPERHVLIIGDSRNTLPAYAKQHPTTAFDIIFIDGGHDYDTAKKDLENSRSFAHPGTIVIMDDVVSDDSLKLDYTLGPERAWREAEAATTLMTLGSEDYGPGYGIIWGKYLQLRF